LEACGARLEKARHRRGADARHVDATVPPRHTQGRRAKDLTTKETAHPARWEEGMAGLLALSAAIDRINEFVGKSVGWLILLSILVSAGNAIIRKAFNMSSNAWLELQWYLFGAAFLLAAAYTLKQNEHIRIDIVYGMFSRRVQHWIDLFGHVFFLMPFVILMISYFIGYVSLSFHNGEVSTNAGGLIIWPAKALLLIGFSLLGLQGISEIIKKIAVMSGVIDDPTPFVATHPPIEVEVLTDTTEPRR
jgi:TRAP-type mannitol/chloroaromatic compound transport system permease small subunit